jgi:hypothetical protein
MSKTKQKNVPPYLWNQVAPPPSPPKCPNKRRKVPQKFETGNPPLPEKFPNLNQKGFLKNWN